MWSSSAEPLVMAVSLLALGSSVTRGAGLVCLGVLAALGIWRLAWCRHPGPLGLLPPVTREDGTRTSAQWYCDRCDKTWPAAFEREQHPVLRFDGYDQSKAPRAARRADELARRQRVLAVSRAGLGSHRRQAHSGVVAKVVPMIPLRNAK